MSIFYAKTEVAGLLAEPPIPDNLRTAGGLGRNLDPFVDGDRLTPQAAEGVDFYRPLTIFPEWNRTNSRQELLNEALSWAARNDQCESMAALVDLGQTSTRTRTEELRFSGQCTTTAAVRLLGCWSMVQTPIFVTTLEERVTV